MSPKSLLLFLAVMFVLTAGALAVPVWFENLLRQLQAPRDQQPAATRQSRDSYKAACRIINPDPYVNIGSVPYPAAPFCPY